MMRLCAFLKKSLEKKKKLEYFVSITPTSVVAFLFPPLFFYFTEPERSLFIVLSSALLGGSLYIFMYALPLLLESVHFPCNVSGEVREDKKKKTNSPPNGLSFMFFLFFFGTKQLPECFFFPPLLSPPPSGISKKWVHDCFSNKKDIFSLSLFSLVFPAADNIKC